jgi:hypothetical protein
MKTLFFAGGILLLVCRPGASGATITAVDQNWTSYLDGSSIPGGPPWQSQTTEGSTVVVPIDATNNALRLDSSDPTGLGTNEWYIGPIIVNELVGASRFRLVDFSATGKENLLAVTVGGGMPTAPSITLVDGRYAVWSYTSDQEILDLGPAVANQFHTAYILARNDGTAQVWWDGTFVVDGAVPVTTSYDGYVEFGSGTFWQTTAATTVDFDWVGYGDATTMIPEASSFVLIGIGLLAPVGLARIRPQ